MVIFLMLSVATVVNHSDIVGNKKKKEMFMFCHNGGRLARGF